MTVRPTRVLCGLAAAALLTLTACGSDDPAPAATDSAPVAGVSSAPAGGQVAQMDAEQVADALRQAGVPLTVTLVYTADNDPNNLLGRPGGYTSKVAFTDSRIDPAEVNDPAPDAIDRGGSVEVYPDATAAAARKEYIQKILQGAGGVLGTEYDYLSGGVVLRVTGKLTPDEAGVYETALAGAIS